MSQRYRVMVVPEGGGQIRSFHLRRSWIPWVAAGVAICLLSLLSGAWMFSIHQKSQSALALLQLENEGLIVHVATVEERLDQIALTVAESEEQEKEARLLAGLDPFDPDARGIEAGGIGLGGPLVTGSLDRAATSADLAFGIEGQSRRLDELERRVAFQRKSYAESIALLSLRRDKLDRTPTITPLRDLHAVSSGYGWREDPFTGAEAFHHGIDMRAPEGTPVYGTAAGTVVAVEDKRDYGLTVVIDHGDGVETRYAHLASSELEPGDTVSRGDVVGTVGSTGRSTGPHVHYEVRVDGVAKDPSHFIVQLPGAPRD